MFALARKLRQKGVLGLNHRNADYILRCNQRRLYPLVDDKLRTKRLAEAAGLAVPPLFAVVEYAGDVEGLAELLAQHQDFVVKPAQGSGGDGIVVINGRSRGYYRKSSGSLISHDDLAFHILNALSGVYSLGGQRDKVLIEYCVQFDPVFGKIAYQGVPDIRIIVYKGVPVMAMVRLPTRQSGGRANLHQGAIGTGVDMATGKTLTAVWRNDIVSEHPDTTEPVSGVEIPHWERMLEIAAGCYELTGLGYQGVDLVLDRDRGPLMLELNARPGLNIQIANRAGLDLRLKAVDASDIVGASLTARRLFAQENFAA
ncbi:MAG: alpha-L-glutamate ligase-like protein [Hyphomicrobiales bacterium]|nr:MAG: alpha-L-glutamate ligase-like protein [Hyphomicrobiales bacterium]